MKIMEMLEKCGLLEVTLWGYPRWAAMLFVLGGLVLFWVLLQISDGLG